MRGRRNVGAGVSDARASRRMAAAANATRTPALRQVSVNPPALVNSPKGLSFGGHKGLVRFGGWNGPYGEAFCPLVDRHRRDLRPGSHRLHRSPQGGHPEPQRSRRPTDARRGARRLQRPSERLYGHDLVSGPVRFEGPLRPQGADTASPGRQGDILGRVPLPLHQDQAARLRPWAPPSTRPSSESPWASTTPWTTSPLPLPPRRVRTRGTKSVPQMRSRRKDCSATL